MTLAITLVATTIFSSSADCQEPNPPPNSGYGGEHSAKNLTPDTIRELSEIERELERVLERIVVLEVRENEFALERVMIAKAFNQLLTKLRSDSRPKKNTTIAEKRNLEESSPPPQPASATEQPPRVIKPDGRMNRADEQNERNHRTKR